MPDTLPIRPRYAPDTPRYQKLTQKSRNPNFQIFKFQKCSFSKFEKSNVHPVGVFCPILEPPKCHIEQNIFVLR